MPEVAVPVVYFMTDINCGAKSIHSRFIKVDKYSQSVGDIECGNSTILLDK